MSTIRKNASAASVTFGVSGYSFNGTIVQSFSAETTSEKQSVMDNVGETAAVSYYDQKKKITVEGIVNGSPNADPGTVVTVNAEDYIVDSFSTSGENSGFRKARLEATKYSSALT